MEEALNHPDPNVSNLVGIYAHDIFWNCTTVARSYAAMLAKAGPYQERTEENNDAEAMIIDSEFQRHIITIIMAAANIRNLVRPNTTRSKSETAAAHKFRLGRFKVFQSLLDGADISEIYNVGVRNALEHFDEYLDSAVRSAMRGEAKGRTSKLYNITLSQERLFKSKRGITHLRSYLIREGEFVIFDQKVNVRKIAVEAEEIARRVTQAFHLPEDEGGIIIVGWD